MNTQEFDKKIRNLLPKARADALDGWMEIAQGTGGSAAFENAVDKTYIAFVLVKQHYGKNIAEQLYNFDMNIEPDYLLGAARHLNAGAEMREVLRLVGSSDDYNMTLPEVLEFDAAVDAFQKDMPIGSLFEKLYSPINFYIRYDNNHENHNGDGNSRESLLQGEAIQYMEAIENEFASINLDVFGDSEIGMAQHLDNTLKKKVQSMFPALELHGTNMFMATAIKLHENLSETEMSDLKIRWEGELSGFYRSFFDDHPINVHEGKLYLEIWNYPSDYFFVDTLDEFSQRFEKPGLTVKQLKSDIASVAVSESRLHRDGLTLSVRLDQKYKEYMEDYLAGSKEGIFDDASQIAVVRSTYLYLSEAHKFSQSDLDYLLLFENPLQVVANEWPELDDVVSTTDVMDEVFNRHSALRDDRQPKLVDPAILELRVLLEDNLRDNVKICMDSILGDTGGHLTAGYVKQAALYKSVHDFLIDGYDFRNGDIKLLLQMDNPLEYVASHWPETVTELSGKQEAVQNILDGKPLAVAREAEGTADKPSVMSQIREAREKPVPRRGASVQDKNNHER